MQLPFLLVSHIAAWLSVISILTEDFKAGILGQVPGLSVSSVQKHGTNMAQLIEDLRSENADLAKGASATRH